MIIRQLVPAAALSALLAVTGALAADVPIEEQIKQLELRRQQAFVRGDIAAIERETAEDYSTINGAGGLSDKARMMSNLRAGRTKVLSVNLDEMTVRVYGEVAVLTGIYRDVNVTEGMEKRTHARFTRLFVKTGAGWQAVAYQQTPIAAPTK